MNSFIVAGTSSGLGKTSLSIGLTYLFSNNDKYPKESPKESYKKDHTETSSKEEQQKNTRENTPKNTIIQTFKVGPDFLDPTWLSLASQRPTYNLDTWMCPSDYCKNLYQEKSKDADISIVEGVMGLFDGALNQAKPRKFKLVQNKFKKSSQNEFNKSSTAQIARTFDLPILLILDASGQAQSFAAVVYGFVNFHKGLKFLGVVANHCGSPNHAKILSQCLEEAKLPPLLGYFLKKQLPTLPHRHLGLYSAFENNATTKDSTKGSIKDNTHLNLIKEIADITSKQIDLELLLII